MSTLIEDLRSAAESLRERAIYESELRRPVTLLRNAADALELAEVDRNCLRAALRAEAEMRTSQTDQG